MKKLLAFAFALCLSVTAWAHWPTQPVTIIVPVPAGGANDQMARSMAPELSKILGVPVVVTNVPGGNYLIAAKQILSNSNNNHTFLINDAIWASGTYSIDRETAQQFRTINMIGQGTLCLGSRLGISRADFLKSSKEKQQANVAVNGVNSLHYQWLTGAGTAVRWNEVPYTGAAPILQALAGGHVDYAVLTISGMKTLLDAGKINCQMVSSTKRLAVFPDVPTFHELGFKGESITQWWGFITKNDTSDEAVETFNAAVQRVVKDGTALETMSAQGFTFEYVPEKSANAVLQKYVTKFAK